MSHARYRSASPFLQLLTTRPRDFTRLVQLVGSMLSVALLAVACSSNNNTVAPTQTPTTAASTPAALPTVSSVAPTSGGLGSTISLTISGTNFISGSTTVAISGSGVTVASTNVTS